MNKHTRKLERHGIFCDRYMTDIKSDSGHSYGKIRGYRILLNNRRLWVRYDGKIWPKGTIKEIIEIYGQ